MQAFEYVIVGGGMAAQRGCAGIRKEDASGTVAIVSAEKHVPYERPPLSKGYITGKSALDSVYLKPASYYSDNRVELFLGTAATELQPDAHTVGLDNGQSLQYGKLLLATGASARALPLPGAELANVYTLRTIEDADGIREAAQAARHAVVIGGSFVGCEVAASLSQMGVPTTMVFPEARLLERIAPDELSAGVRARFERAGIQVRAGRKPVSVRGEVYATGVTLDDGQVLDADLVVMGVGVRLNTQLARQAGLELTAQGAVSVDRYLRTSAADVYAAGDIVAWPDSRYGTQLHVEHWDVARTQGYRAGRNMAGASGAYAAVPYFFSDMLDLSFEVWGNLAQWDRAIQRGALDAGKLGLLYESAGRVTGALAVGLTREETEAISAIVGARPELADVSGAFGDTAADLTDVANRLGRARTASVS